MPTFLMLVNHTSNISLTLEFASATISSFLTAIFFNIFDSLGLTVSSGRTVGLVLIPFTVPKGPAFCGSPTTTTCFSALPFFCSAAINLLVKSLTCFFNSSFLLDKSARSDLNMLTRSEDSHVVDPICRNRILYLIRLMQLIIKTEKLVTWLIKACDDRMPYDPESQCVMRNVRSAHHLCKKVFIDNILTC
ncbi:hypothetical protein Hanom_Chr09g00845551 [Helianthus anomalus]